MNKTSVIFLGTLLVWCLGVVSLDVLAGEGASAPQGEPAVSTPGADKPATASKSSPPVPASTTAKKEEASPAKTTLKAGGSEEATAEKKPEPVTGAFGLTLGDRFDPTMVAKVIGREEITYSGREKTKFKGFRYQIEPKVAGDDFENYLLDTTEQGVIYAIHGEHKNAGKQKECKEATKRLAAELEGKYGKPRAQDGFGSWYSFRDMSRKDYRGVRLFAQHCRTGRYSIVYSDDQVRKAELASEPETQTTQAEPEAQATQPELEAQTTQAEPEAKTTQVEPEAQATQAEPETQATQAEPKTQATQE